MNEVTKMLCLTDVTDAIANAAHQPFKGVSAELQQKEKCIFTTPYNGQPNTPKD